MADTIKKLACLLLAALFLLGGCGSEETVSAGIDGSDSQDGAQETVTAGIDDNDSQDDVQATTPTASDVPSDYATKDPIDLAVATMDTFVGTWNGKVVMTAEQREQMKEIVGEEGFQTLMKSAETDPFVFKLHGDRTSRTLSKSQDIAGKWELSEDGKKITIKADARPNTVTPDVVLLVSADGKSLTWDEPLSMPFNVVFTK